jgi:hypothetical protein
MKNNIVLTITCCALVAVLVGCTKRPPKCSAADTKDILASIYVRQFSMVDESMFSNKDMLDYITVHTIRKIDYNKERNTYICHATVQFGEDGSLYTQYESYFDEETGEHMVLTQGLHLGTQIAVASYIRIQRERLKQKRGN